MKVLHLVTFGGVGGAQHSILGLLSRLDRGRFEPVVGCPAGGDFEKRLAAAGVPALPLTLPGGLAGASRLGGPLALLRALANAPGAVLRMRRLIRESGAGLVHTHDLKTHVLGGLAARLASRPCIWHLRDDVGSGALRLALCAFGALLPSRIIAISRRVASRLAGPAGRKTVVIYNGVDIAELERQAAERPIPSAGSGGNRTRLLGMVGQFAPLKGQDLFLRMAAILAPRYPGLRFLIVGDAVYETSGRFLEYKRELEGLARDLGIADRVSMPGALPAIGGVLRSLELLVVPSRSEGLGRVAIEAMALERPVVAARVGGLPEVVEDGVTGILVAPDDPEALARAAASLLDDPDEAARLGRAGRLRVLERFTIEEHTRRVAEVYEAVPGAG